jgi:hypothetical protein
MPISGHGSTVERLESRDNHQKNPSYGVGSYTLIVNK